LEGPETEGFIARVTELLRAQTPGVLLNAHIEDGLASAVAGTLGHAAVERLSGGQKVAGDAYCYANTVMRTTAAAFRDEPALQVEHFGPVTLFVVAPGNAALHEALEALHGNLTATVHAADEERD